MHTTSIHTSSHDEHSASSYSHEHTHGHGQYRRHDYPYQNAGSVAPSPTECDFPLHAEHAPAHAQGQVQVQGRRTGQAGEGYHLDNSAGGGGGGLEYVFDDPRRPYYCQQLAPSPVRPSSWHYSTISGAGDIGDRAGSIAGTGSISGSHSGSNAAADGRKSMQAQSQQRTNNLAPGSSGISTSSGFSKTASFGSSSLASNTSFLYQDADYALPFSHAHVQHGSAQHYSKAQSFGSFASSTGGGGGAEAAHSDASDASKYPWSSYPPYGAGVHGGRPSTNTAGPDRYVRTVLTYASYQPAGSRRGNRATAGSGGSIGSVQPDRPLSFKSMAKGPEGSNRVVLAANDGTPPFLSPVHLSAFVGVYNPPICLPELLTGPLFPPLTSASDRRNHLCYDSKQQHHKQHHKQTHLVITTSTRRKNIIFLVIDKKRDIVR
ncbi:hypothetical protein QFC22_002000 [Naganishia vaughanmartiniae]|uniref:Uncharacterized protein n=1 Tax=Naganishia vaughanmartiniae TaxID=1424756 RepID=A0ACC2XG08_9TREE|nr:hypothetical protein QFC22_002000 [Naganishia vaughanmartiniae]